MNVRLGRKIRELRKERKISQESLARYLGVSFQAVSKWENEATMPEVTLIPVIASFFRVSTDELFDYNRLEIERRVEEIYREAARIRDERPDQAESILREGLRQYPGNEVLMNNLLYVLRFPEQRDEVKSICRTLIECAEDDEVRFDAMRILAELHHDMGEISLVEKVLDGLPEIYFTKLECKARLLDGKKSLEAAQKQMYVSIEQAVEMLMLINRRLHEQEEDEEAEKFKRIAYGIVDSFKKNEGEVFGKQLQVRFLENTEN